MTLDALFVLLAVAFVLVDAVLRRRRGWGVWELTCAFTLLCNDARAGSVAALRSFDDGVTLMFVASTRSDYDGVTIINLAVAKPGTTVKSVQVQGNKVSLVTCQKDTCPYRWPRTSMRSGSNDISILATLSNGQQYITTGTIGQPPRTTTTIDTTVFPPRLAAVAAEPPPCGYLADGTGGRLTSSLGFLLAC